MNNYGYFRKEEMMCKCGCGLIKTQPRFIFKINLLRDIVGHPLRANSWTRCTVHNAAVGGKVTSSHLLGWACDIDTPSEYILNRILLAAGEINFKGVGIGQGFIHLDDDPAKAPNRFWIY